MKAHIFCCVYTQIAYLGKIRFWGKMFSNHQIAGFFKSAVSPKKIDEIARFFEC